MGIFQTKIEPSIRLVLIFLYSFYIAFQNKIEFIDSIFILAVYLIQNVDLKELLIKISKVNIFILSTVLTLILFENNYEFAYLIFIRANFILIFSLILTNSFTSFDIFKALNNLYLPNKLNLIIFFTIKHIEILTQIANNLIVSLRIKSFKAKFNRFTFQTYGYLFANLIIQTFEKSKTLEMSLKLKFHKKELTPKAKIELKMVDITILSLLILRILFKSLTTNFN